MKKAKHLDFYFKYMQVGCLPYGGGLCGVSKFSREIDAAIFKLFEPTENDLKELLNENQMARSLLYIGGGYWGSGVELGDPLRIRGFTPLRQTIVLFMAAINGEL